MYNLKKLFAACYFCSLLLAAVLADLFAASSSLPVVLIKTINISGSGGAPRMRMGDLNGDGRLDILMVQATAETPSQVAQLTAFDGCTGTKLWTLGDGAGLGGTDRDEPAQIWDIDNDGYNEVVAVMNSKILFLDGATGATKKSMNMPTGFEDCHDCISFANFTGAPYAHPTDMVFKDRYTRAVAIDVTGKQLWTFSGITGHNPWSFDMNGDGLDEFFIGYSLLSAKGVPMYPAPINVDHPDCIWVGDVDGDPSNGYEVVYGLAVNPSTQCVNTRTGKVVWTNSDRRESQQVMLADFRPDLKGLEVYGLDRVNRTDQDALFIIDGTGKQIWEETPDNSGYLTAIKMVYNWDGTHTPYCLAIKRGGGVLPEVRDGKGVIVAHAGADGLNACVGDFGGDDKDEAIFYSSTTASIYADAQFDYTQPPPNPGHPRKQTKFYGMYSRYGSGDALENSEVATIGGGSVPAATAACGTSMHKVMGKCLTLRELAPGKSASVTLFDVSGKVVYSATVRNKVVDIGAETGKAEGMYLAKIIYER